ncbi:uncharacterized protein N7482_008948 [Penicillium canariense]|uniref:Uncharacterized protein n=1 Tax=Penicillium canariense TaxID=189055 RepID=A0A9W9HW54_9EURO|nr:uncharacterized protein N7482_008948 [Penicillium canariense]KAJ5157848.1 hypothetical protein N7482_008948 [Penicillium canariense]
MVSDGRTERWSSSHESNAAEATVKICNTLAAKEAFENASEENSEYCIFKEQAKVKRTTVDENSWSKYIVTTPRTRHGHSVGE